MTDIGFYHPERGYWQAIDPVQTVEELLESYPDGTIQVPLKPGEHYVFDAETSEWIAVAPPPKTPADYPLKPWQFTAMVNYLQIGDAIEQAIKAIPDDLTRAVVMARYQTSTVYDRADPLFDQLAAQIGLSLADLDDAWMRIANMTNG